MIKRLGWPLTSLIAVGGAVLVALLLNELGTAWSAAIQGTATVVLVIVTSIYAYSTFKLVEAQELGPTRQTQVGAISKILTVAHANKAIGGKLATHFRGDLPTFSPDKAHHMRSLLGDAESVRDQLLEQVILLPENEVFDVCWDAIWATWDAAMAGRAVLDAATDEGIASEDHQRPFDVDNVKANYYGEYRDYLRNKPEWDEVVSGDIFEHCTEELNKLNDSARGYIVESRR